MKGHNFLLRRTWMLPMTAVVLVAANLIVPYVLLHTGWSFAVVSSAAILLVIEHLGLLGSLYAVLRRRSRQSKSSEHCEKNDGTTMM
jgi:VIT1/CCC1 family predicted Fe2+/Mn2+ transporter